MDLLTLMQAAGSSIALLNLAYSTHDGVNWNGTYTSNGTVNATNLACYFPHNNAKSSCPIGKRRFERANLYGQMGLGFDCKAYMDISEVQNSREPSRYYCRRTPGNEEFAFRFYEYNPNDHQRTYPFFTDRTIRVSSGECREYQHVTQSPGLDLDGVPAATNYTFTNGTYTDCISIPKANDGRLGITYIYRGLQPPGMDVGPLVDCGLRCVWVWVHKTAGPQANSTFYQCPVTVSQVNNATFDYHKISNEMARTAAASIALHSGWSGNREDQNWTSFNFYAAEYVSLLLCVFISTLIVIAPIFRFQTC